MSRDVHETRMMGFFRMIILMADPIIPRVGMMGRDDKKKNEVLGPGGWFSGSHVFVILESSYQHLTCLVFCCVDHGELSS